jgi:hypothetical protein
MFDDDWVEFYKKAPPPLPERNPMRVAPQLPPGIRLTPLPENAIPPTNEGYRQYQREHPPERPVPYDPNEPEIDVRYDDGGGLLSGLDREPSMEALHEVYVRLKSAKTEKAREEALRDWGKAMREHRRWERQKSGGQHRA